MSKHKAWSGSAPWTMGMRFIALSIILVTIALLAGAIFGFGEL